MTALVVMTIIGGVASIIMGICAFVLGTDTHYYQGPSTHYEEYKPRTPQQPPNPTIAEQFDGRLTNVFRNPMEGIL